jgi:hypothetical protein
MKMSNIDYMKNIALKNKIIKEEKEEKEEEEENDDDEDDDDIDENEEDKKRTWIKVKGKLSEGVFSSDILKEFPSFYENYNDRIMYYHFKYVTKQTENKFQENISDTFINNVSILNSNDSFSILPKSKTILFNFS